MNDFSKLIGRLQDAGRLPHLLTQQQVNAINRALQRYCDQIGGNLVGKATQEISAEIQRDVLSILNPQKNTRAGVEGTVTEGMNPTTATEAINTVLKKFGADVLAQTGFVERAISIATDVARGAGRYIAQNSDQAEVDAIPALELLRVYDRDVPRGQKRVHVTKENPEGTLVEVAGDDWPSRWRAAANDSGDLDALRVLEDKGRMVALKSSDIWQSLGDGAGGYQDTLGNPFPPFAFNSGYDVNAVSRKDAEELGLLDTDEQPKPAKIDFENFFADVKSLAA
jgi:hypothetical protein